jgi:hypothetical protein
MFNVRCSTFIRFFFDQTGRFGMAASAWPLRRPAAGLNLEPISLGKY